MYEVLKFRVSIERNIFVFDLANVLAIMDVWYCSTRCSLFFCCLPYGLFLQFITNIVSEKHITN
jgi:hypothetical protein